MKLKELLTAKLIKKNHWLNTGGLVSMENIVINEKGSITINTGIFNEFNFKDCTILDGIYEKCTFVNCTIEEIQESYYNVFRRCTIEKTSFWESNKVYFSTIEKAFVSDEFSAFNSKIRWADINANIYIFNCQLFENKRYDRTSTIKGHGKIEESYIFNGLFIGDFDIVKTVIHKGELSNNIKLTDCYDKRLLNKKETEISKITNSQIGSLHWFSNLIGVQIRFFEHLAKRTELTDEFRKIAQENFEVCQELNLGLKDKVLKNQRLNDGLSQVIDLCKQIKEDKEIII